MIDLEKPGFVSEDDAREEAADIPFEWKKARRGSDRLMEVDYGESWADETKTGAEKSVEEDEVDEDETLEF